MSDEIWMICEGSGCPAHSCGIIGMGLCAMCGAYVRAQGPTNVAILHKRDDILARLERGDFDEMPARSTTPEDAE